MGPSEQKRKDEETTKVEGKSSEKLDTQEYHNPVYETVEKPENLGAFSKEDLEGKDSEFSEVKL